MVLILVFGIKAIFHIKLDYVDRWVGKQNIRLKLLMVSPLASTGAEKGRFRPFFIYFLKLKRVLPLWKRFLMLKTTMIVKTI